VVSSFALRWDGSGVSVVSGFVVLGVVSCSGSAALNASVMASEALGALSSVGSAALDHSAMAYEALGALSSVGSAALDHSA
jgi:uncharacterized protein YjfI (DUF2170 family)